MLLGVVNADVIAGTTTELLIDLVPTHPRLLVTCNVAVKLPFVV